MPHGNHWAAIHPDTETLIAEMVPRICQQGEVLGEAHFSRTHDDGIVALETVYGLRLGDDAVRFVALIVTDKRSEPDKKLLDSAYPWLADGKPYEVEVVRVTNPGGHVEGVVHASIFDASLAFFDPLYFLNRERYRPGSKLRVSFAGLVHLIRRPEARSVEIKEGPMLELERERRLREDPSLDVNSITSVSVSLEGMTGMFPREQDDEFEIRTVAEQFTRFRTDTGFGFWRVECVLMRPDDNEFRVPLFGSDPTMGDLRLSPGEDLEGIIWLQGTPID